MGLSGWVVGVVKVVGVDVVVKVVGVNWEEGVVGVNWEDGVVQVGRSLVTIPRITCPHLCKIDRNTKK